MRREDLRVGDVVRYSPQPAFAGQVDVHWCREGTAVVQARADGSLYAADTYWGSGSEAHLVTDAELESAEVAFNLNDYDELPRYEKHSSRAKWEKHAPANRELITSQHGLERRWFLRKGATEDLDTQIQNARERLAKARADRDSAQREVEWRTKELDALVAAGSTRKQAS